MGSAAARACERCWAKRFFESFGFFFVSSAAGAEWAERGWPAAFDVRSPGTPGHPQPHPHPQGQARPTREQIEYIKRIIHLLKQWGGWQKAPKPSVPALDLARSLLLDAGLYEDYAGVLGRYGGHVTNDGHQPGAVGGHYGSGGGNRRGRRSGYSGGYGSAFMPSFSQGPIYQTSQQGYQGAYQPSHHTNYHRKRKFFNY